MQPEITAELRVYGRDITQYGDFPNIVSTEDHYTSIKITNSVLQTRKCHLRIPLNSGNSVTFTLEREDLLTALRAVGV